MTMILCHFLHGEEHSYSSNMAGWKFIYCILHLLISSTTFFGHIHGVFRSSLMRSASSLGSFWRSTALDLTSLAPWPSFSPSGKSSRPRWPHRESTSAPPTPVLKAVLGSTCWLSLWSRRYRVGRPKAPSTGSKDHSIAVWGNPLELGGQKLRWQGRAAPCLCQWELPKQIWLIMVWIRSFQYFGFRKSLNP